MVGEHLDWLHSLRSVRLDQMAQWRHAVAARDHGFCQLAISVSAVDVIEHHHNCARWYASKACRMRNRWLHRCCVSEPPSRPGTCRKRAGNGTLAFGEDKCGSSITNLACKSRDACDSGPGRRSAVLRSVLSACECWRPIRAAVIGVMLIRPITKCVNLVSTSGTRDTRLR